MSLYYSPLLLLLCDLNLITHMRGEIFPITQRHFGFSSWWCHDEGEPLFFFSYYLYDFLSALWQKKKKKGGIWTRFSGSNESLSFLRARSLTQRRAHTFWAARVLPASSAHPAQVTQLSAPQREERTWLAITDPGLFREGNQNGTDDDRKRYGVGAPVVRWLSSSRSK